MSINRRKTKTDANQAEIFEHLRKHGVYVKDLSAAGQILDSLTYKTDTGLLEIKKEGSAAKWTRIQLTFIAYCPAPIGIAKDKDFALQFALDPKRYGLKQKQKDALAFFLDKQPKDKKFFTPSEIESVLGISQTAEEVR